MQNTTDQKTYSVLQGLSGPGQVPNDSVCTLASAKAPQASTVREDMYDQHLCSRDRM